jgi:hypothetical protein
MASWKGAAMTAAAVLSFVAVKALPWALGFAGGKYLYRAAMGTPGEPGRYIKTAIPYQISKN